MSTVHDLVGAARVGRGVGAYKRQPRDGPRCGFRTRPLRFLQWHTGFRRGPAPPRPRGRKIQAARELQERPAMNHDDHDDHDDDRDHHGGLAHDLGRLIASTNRRRALRLFAGASLIPILGCGDDSPSTTGTGGSGGGAGTGGSAGSGGSAGTDGSSGTGGTGGSGRCSTIPEETGGPYPGDGTNGPNVLTQSGVVRGDIRSSFGSLSGTAAGVPLTIELTLVNTSASCAPLAGYAVYLWHCDRDSNYSLYTIATQNYLRGVQAADASGKVSFTTIFPGCYSGRWPHAHFEIYPSLDKAMSAGNRVRTSQLALPQAVCNTVYATAGYETSVTNLSRITLASDNVFSDGSTLQVATVTGSVAAGYTASLLVGVAG
jgi:protocatechuate 3,4-dioxygenase beta subunit